MTTTLVPEGALPRDPDLKARMRSVVVVAKKKEEVRDDCLPSFGSAVFNGRDTTLDLPDSRTGKFFSISSSPEPFGIAFSITGSQLCGRELTWDVQHGSDYSPPLIVKQIASDGQLFVGWLPGGESPHISSSFAPIVIQALLDREPFGTPITLIHE